ncbi:hypothetical protein QBC33DRAFT_516912 [Phialemonium atrogriseum]|uniref:Uncharacterized protein n=1 Tax=Phialemonium atrogriseum TaxID=1093897 RepID=A0AAJ0BVP7_9PEZI|nr:uncharacterized protein QBC33DRAFT_516912 [Phialemonium atrogriseum]KAK1765136.1 hypothetical protein QBC33DRAFT_516912 [Phialemonium atrogriseum]
MALLERVTDQELLKLKGKTVIITGAASGIGKSAALLAHAAGANVVIADLSEDTGEALNEFKERILYVKADVSSWSEVLNLFTQAWDHFGSIDVVLSNAGTHNFETILDDELAENGTLAPPNLKSLEVNLHAAVYCAKAAIYFFKKQPEKNCQLVFTGSAASILDTPPLFLYCAGKAGVLGLMRGMRKGLPSDKITVNMVAPWMTVTPMLPDWVREKWGDLPANDASGVARALLLPALRPDLNGKTLWVAGNDVIEIEDALHDAQPQWLGSQLSANVDEGQRRMGISPG